MSDSIFEIIEPSGKRFEIFENGEIRGFAENSIVLNRIHARLASEGSIAKASACPTNSETSSRFGADVSRELRANNMAENMAVAFGEK